VGGLAANGEAAFGGASKVDFGGVDVGLGPVEGFAGLDGAITGRFDGLRRGTGPQRGRSSCVAGFATPGMALPGLPWSSSTVFTET
jgi:hypothetical protein